MTSVSASRDDDDGRQGGVGMLINGRKDYSWDETKQDPQQYQGHPSRKKTQQDQDEEDDDKRKRALKDLVQSWMDRLQLISVITTFFASTEAGLLQTTTPSSDSPPSPALNAANAGIIGALILHSFAAILSFLGSFVLVRYKLDEAKKEEAKVEGHAPSPSDSLPLPHRLQSQRSHTQPDVEKSTIQGHSNSFQRIRSPSTYSAPVQSCNPRLEQVYGFTKHPPTDLMRRCHGLCIALSTVGFVLALMGTVCYAWAVQPVSVAAFSSAVMGVCLLSAAIVLIR